MSNGASRVREGILTILSEYGDGGPASPMRVINEEGDNPRSPLSPVNAPPENTPAFDLQKEANKVRVLFPTTPADLVQKHRRLTTIFHEFSKLASSIVEDRVIKLLISGCLRQVDAFRTLVGLPSAGGSTEDSVDDLPTELRKLKFLDLDSFTTEGICFYLVTEPGTLLANSVVTTARVPKDLDSIASFERARKLAHNEVKMRSHLLSIAHIESLLQLPLCAAVDFAGFTFFAEVDLKLGQKTQIGGIGLPHLAHQFSRRVVKGDAAPSVRAAEHLSRAIGLTCRLRAHTGGGATTFLPQDMQIHLGGDGVYYAVLTRRLLAPVICGPGGEAPPENTGSKNSHIIQNPTIRFLPQFSERFCENTALNPDAWMDDDARQVDSSDYDVLTYSSILHKKAISHAVEFLFMLDTERSKREPQAEGSSAAVDKKLIGKPLLAPIAPSFTIESEADHVEPHQRHSSMAGGSQSNLSFTLAPSSKLNSLRSFVAASEVKAHVPQINSDTGLPESTLREMLDTYRDISNLPPSAIKTILHTFGVNMKFIGHVLMRLEIRLQQHDDSCAKSAAKGAFVTPPATQRVTSRGERFASPEFLGAHPIAKAVRLELVSRCGRIAFHHWFRKLALTHSFVDKASVLKIKSQTKDDRSFMEALISRCKRELAAKTVDFLFRVSGDCLSFQDDSDARVWVEQLVPISKVTFGYDLVFVRERVSTSTVSSFSGHELGLSTGSRMRLRPMKNKGDDSKKKFDDDRTIAARPINITRVDFTAWGTVDDEQLRLPLAASAVTTHASHGGSSGDPNSSFSNGLSLQPSDLGDFTVCSTSQNGEPPSVRMDGKKQASGIAPTDVRLGAKQDYRLVQRICDHTNVQLVRSSTHDFTGVWANVAPCVTLLETKCPLTPEVLCAVHSGLSQPLERKMLDDIKEKRKLLSPGAPEAPLIGYYYKMCILHMMTAKASQAVECCKKMRDAQVRDLGNNELGVVMTTLLEARCEMDRKRFTDAVEQGNHALSLAQQFANNSQVVAAAMLAILDGIDALGAPTYALRTKKADISTQLVPLCAKFGLAVGRVKAREALSRITSDRATQQQLLPLGQAVKSVLSEQGLDAESASMSVRFALLSESVRALPTAVKAVEHCIPLNSTLFRPTMNGVLDFCFAQLTSRMSDIPPNSVTLEELRSFLDIRSDATIDPSISVYNLDIQTPNLPDAKRIRLNENVSRSTYIEGRSLSSEEELGVILSCALYTFKFWVTAILHSIPAEKRGVASQWDPQTIARFADSVNAARAFSQIHPIVSIQLNHLLLCLLHLELGGDDVLGPRHTTSPIAISWAYDLMTTAHRVVVAEIQRRGLSQPRQRSAHLVELNPSKEDQLETLSEIMLPVKLGLEVLETLRNMHSFLVAAAAKHFEGASGAFPQLFAGEKSATDESDGGAAAVVKSVCAQSNMVPIVADVFTASFCGYFAKNGTVELDELLLLCKSYFTGDLVKMVGDIGRRFKLQKFALWTNFLNYFSALYDAESHIFTPVHNPKTPLRTESQLSEMATTLTMLTSLASANIGAVENQDQYEQMLASLSTRIKSTHRGTAQSTSALLTQGGQLGASMPMITVVSSNQLSTTSPLTEEKRTISPSQHQGTSKSLLQSATCSGGAAINASIGNISAVASSVAVRRPTQHVSSDVVNPASGPQHQTPYSKLWDRIRADDSAKEPFFRVSPSSGLAGTEVLVEWQLPPMAPPRYGCIGIFPDDDRPLVQSQALDIRTGLQFRQVTGCVHDFLLPSKPGAYVIAYFTTGHSEGLPFGRDFVARIRSLPGERSVSQHQRSSSNSEQRKQPREIVTLPPVSYSPCDTKKSQLDRLTILAQKDSAMRMSLGLPPAQYDISSALEPPADVLEAQRRSYERHIRPAQYANVGKGVQCVVLFSSTDRKAKRPL